MTSVPNHLQPLSGSKLKQAVIVGLLSLCTLSCSLFKSTGAGPGTVTRPENEPVKTEPDKHTEKEPKDTVKTSILDLKRKRIEDSLNVLYPALLKPRYSMAVFLPLYLEDMDRESKQKGAISLSQDFYKGLLLAADTLELCGANLDIHVIDSENPFLGYASLSDTLDKINADLMLGPLLDKTRLTFLDTLSRYKKINWVSPLQVSDNCMGSNYYFESIPSGVVTGVQTAEMVQHDYPGYHVILVNETTTKDNPIAKAFVSDFPIKDSVKIVNYMGKPSSTFDPGFPLTEKNIIFIPSKNEAFVSSVLSKLRVNTQEIVVVGVTSWLFFHSQEGDLWEKFKIHVSSPFHMNYSDTGLQNFVRKYRWKYNQEPSVWSFIGFDETIFYGKQLSEHGRYFQRYLLDEKGTSLLHSTYMLEPDKNCAGWKNRYINMLKFENYELQPVNSVEK